MNRIKELRKQAGLTQQALAEKLNLVPSTVSGWEVGRNEPDYETLRKLSTIFNCTVDFILGGDKNEKPTVVGSDDGKTVHLDISGLSPENRAKVEEYALLLLGSQRKPEE